MSERRPAPRAPDARGPRRASLPLACLTLLAVLLAGCAQDPVPDAAPPRAGGAPGADPVDALSTWNWTECQVMIALVPVQPERLRPYMPEGFEPAPMGLLLVDSTPATSLAFEIFRCASTDAVGGPIFDVAYGSVFTGATPPATAPWIDGADATYVKWDTLVPDEARRRILAATGAPVHAGEADIQSGPAGAAATGMLTFEGVGGFSMDRASLSLSGGGDADAFRFVEYTATPTGLLGYIGEVRDSSLSGGLGTLTIVPGTWLDDVIPARSSPARVMTGTLSLADGRVEHSPAE